MPPERRIWFMIANGSRARIVIPLASGGPYETLWRSEAPALWTGSAGTVMNSHRANASADAAASTRRPPTDRRWEKARFGWQLAKRLNESYSRRDFDALVLVAPRRALRTIHEGLDPVAASCIIAEISKDLTGVHDAGLAVHLATGAGR